jgi:hypothetical protein
VPNRSGAAKIGGEETILRTWRGNFFGILQWEFQDPEMEVLYHIRSYLVVIFTEIGLKNRP